MPTLAERLDRYRRIANRVRAIPGFHGLRPYSVAILITTYSGDYTGRGDAITEVTPITEANGQPPKVRQLNTEELALTGLGKGALRIGPITPAHDTGGTAIETIKPCLAAGQTLHVLVTGPEYPNGAKFALKSFNSDHAIHFTMDVEPVSENGP